MYQLDHCFPYSDPTISLILLHLQHNKVTKQLTKANYNLYMCKETDTIDYPVCESGVPSHTYCNSA